MKQCNNKLIVSILYIILIKCQIFLFISNKIGCHFFLFLCINLWQASHSIIQLSTSLTKLANNCFNQFISVKEFQFPSSIIFIESSILPLNQTSLQVKFEDERFIIQDKIPFDEASIYGQNGIYCENVIIDWKYNLSELPTNWNLIIDEVNDTVMKVKQIPSNVVEIDSWSFLDKSITSLTIPSTLLTLWRRKNIFGNCHSILPFCVLYTIYF